MNFIVALIWQRVQKIYSQTSTDHFTLVTDPVPYHWERCSGNWNATPANAWNEQLRQHYLEPGRLSA